MGVSSLSKTTAEPIKSPGARVEGALLHSDLSVYGKKAAQESYEKLYCARGECPENRIKEQQLDLFADLTSSADPCDGTKSLGVLVRILSARSIVCSGVLDA